jgi:pimeloyl-ACP methyl ester carboxylesterase
MTGQMYVEYRIPAKRTYPYPIIMVHGGTMSGTNYTGTPDGREGWAQYFIRQGYAVYVVDQVGKGRSSYMEQTYGPTELVDSQNSQQRYIAQEKYKLWPQAHLHAQWPGSGNPDDPSVQQLLASQIPAIRDFTKQQMLNTPALISLLDKIGPAILLVHSQAGAFGWPVADARPNLVKAILAVEPNGPPAYSVEFIGAPDYFRQGRPRAHLRYNRHAALLFAARRERIRTVFRAGGEFGWSRPCQVLDAGNTGAAAAEPAKDACANAYC